MRGTVDISLFYVISYLLLRTLIGLAATLEISSLPASHSVSIRVVGIVALGSGSFVDSLRPPPQFLLLP